MDMPVTPTAPADALEESFDLVARQEKTETDVAALRTDVDEIGRAAQRPAISGANDNPEVKGFVDG